MHKSKLLAAILGTLIAAPALADEASPMTASVSLVSNYLYRGISQTGNNPALQGGFDYADPSGIYAGVWGSNISWLSDFGTTNNASLEMDTYLGYKADFAEDFNYDLGFLRYNYPGKVTAGNISANTNEVYVGAGYKWLAFKYSRSLSNLFGARDSKGSTYLEIGASYTAEDAGITFGAHYGDQTVAHDSAASYRDYNVKVSKELAGYEVGAMYSNTSLDLTDPQGNKLAGGAFVVSLSRSL
jgi:uncharacterized protein (TIGR02001 family)